MSTARSLFNLFIRLSLYGFYAGAFLCSALYILYFVTNHLFTPGTDTPLMLVFLLVWGAVMALPIGALFGLGLGIFNGLIATVITRLFFSPPHNTNFFRFSINGLIIALTLVPFLMLHFYFYKISLYELMLIDGYDPIQLMRGIMFTGGIAGFLGWCASRRATQHYISEIGMRKAH